MHLADEKVIDDINTSTEIENNNSVELIRKCSQQNSIYTIWENSFIASSLNDPKFNNFDETPPFVSIMITDEQSFRDENLTDSSTQTEQFVTLPENCCIANIDLSFSKDFTIQDSTSNESNETSEHSLRSKRFRRDSTEHDDEELRPWKKTKCIESCTSSTCDLAETKQILGASLSSGQLSSNSEASFKSINSNHSFKIRRRRMKSDSNLLRDAVQRSRKRTTLSRHSYSETSTPGGTPRKERNLRRNAKSKAWNIVDICAWIGKKGFQSITKLYSDDHREPIAQSKEISGGPTEEIKEIKKYLKEIDLKHAHLADENKELKGRMAEMMAKMEELEGKLRNQQSQPRAQGAPPPPPPPPPPSPPPPPQPFPNSKLPVRSNTIPRCGSAPPRIVGPRLTITPEDIANVKLRKAKDNPVRTKSMQNGQQPLVTQQMLQSTRARLGRARPVTASTPKQQLTELEKCLLQESSVTSLYRRRVVRTTFRSAEELRPRPYPAPRSPCSPRSPRSNSLPRVNVSPLKFPNGVMPT